MVEIRGLGLGLALALRVTLNPNSCPTPNLYIHHLCRWVHLLTRAPLLIQVQEPTRGVNP